MLRVNLTPVYVLHTRPFGNTSLIVDLLSELCGRVTVIARSARGMKSRYQGKLQLFTPMLASWSGRYELKTLGNIELDGMPHQLNQKPLFCGFYLNELLMQLLHKEDPHPQLYALYRYCLSQFEKNETLAPTLRLFEKKLLDELGYGLPLTHEAETRKPICAGLFYRYEHHHGFFPCPQHERDHFLGEDLLSIAAECFESNSVEYASKRLMRHVLTHLLGNKRLHSREFF